MTQENVELFSIDQVSRDIGIGKDTLRVWERRYGFPDPVRNRQGERSYTDAQVERLRAISRLLDCGYRPGQVVALNGHDLQALNQPQQADKDAINPRVEAIVEAAKNGNVRQLSTLIQRSIAEQETEDFVLGLASELLSYIGGSWASGGLPIYVEHLLSYHLSAAISVANDKITVDQDAPRVILSTLPGEQHQLGLQLTESILRNEGFETLNFGAETPLDQLQIACEDLKPKILALSFSSVQKRNMLMPQLRELDNKIPIDVALLVGGEGVKKLRSVPKRIQVVKALEQLPALVSHLS